MIDKYFSPQRFGLYLKKEILLNLKNLLIASGSILGLLIVIQILSLNGNANPQSYRIFLQSLYVIGLVGGGLIYVSSSFNDLNQQGKSYFFLSLPASTFEKFLSVLVLSSIAWTIWFTTLFFIFAGIAGEIRSIHLGIPYQFIEFDHFELAKPIQGYIALNSLFLLGAATFKGRAFIKTGLAIFLLGTATFFIFILSGWGVLHDFLDPEAHNIMESVIKAINKGMQPDHEPFQSVINTVTIYCMPVVAWTIAYFKLKEREI